MITCDRCGGETRAKVITSKKAETFGTKYTVQECLGSCMSGKFHYSFFPPKEPVQTAPPTQQQNGNAPKQSGDALIVLRSIDISLKNILAILQAKAKQIPIQEEELNPDEQAPF